MTSQAFYATKYGGYWGDEVKWSFDRQPYDDAVTLTHAQLGALPPVGAVVRVLVDPQDPSWYSIAGSFVDRQRSTVSIGLLVVPALVSFVVAVLLAIVGMRLRSVVRVSAWEPATVAGVRTVRRRHGGRRHLESDIVGNDPRLPMKVREYIAPEGKPVWIAFGPKDYVACRPGAFGLRYGRLS